MSMTPEEKRNNLQDDLSISLTEIQAVLDHWNLPRADGWQQYLIVRREGKPQSFLVLAHPADKGDFAERLEAFHRTEADRGR